jgi:hypothetical protein
MLWVATELYILYIKDIKFFNYLDGMMNSIDRNIAEKFKRKLEKIIPVLDFKVYGSRARGDAFPDSDLDVFIKVERIDNEKRRRISETAWEVGYEMDRIISTFVATQDQILNGPLGASAIIYQIEKEGVPV